MANATRRAAWRSGPANGWHDDLVWYAAAIHQMRALTPDSTTSCRSYQALRRHNFPAARGRTDGRRSRGSGTTR